MRFFKCLFTYFIKVPLSALYGLCVYIRNMLYDRGVFKSTKFDIPIINIGNITVGGTGKTPHTEFILSLLSTEYKTATLSRGYKRKSKGFHYVQTTDSADTSGDEPLQIKQKFPDVIVSVEGNRVYAINKLLKDNNGLQVILLDDAFQHRKVNAGLNIVLIDYHRPLYRDHMLPWGRLRDNKSQLKRAEIVIVTKCPGDLQPIDLRMISKYTNLRPYQKLFFTTFEYGEKEPVFTDVELPDLLTGKGTVAIAGIASPKVFISYVQRCFGNVKPLVFADHHKFTKADIKRICKLAENAAVVITTEKDCMRLRQCAGDIPAEIKSKMFYIPIKVKFLRDEDKFINHILSYVRTNKNDSRLY